MIKDSFKVPSIKEVVKEIEHNRNVLRAERQTFCTCTWKESVYSFLKKIDLRWTDL